MPAVIAIALAAGLFNPSVAAGWTAQLPRLVTEGELARGSALDALTYSAASLAGPALAAVVAAGFGARAAVLTAATLVVLAVPAASSLSRCPAATGPAPAPRRQMAARQLTAQLAAQMAAGFAVIATRRPLLRATVTSVASSPGSGCCWSAARCWARSGSAPRPAARC